MHTSIPKHPCKYIVLLVFFKQNGIKLHIYFATFFFQLIILLKSSASVELMQKDQYIGAAILYSFRS